MLELKGTQEELRDALGVDYVSNVIIKDGYIGNLFGRDCRLRVIEKPDWVERLEIEYHELSERIRKAERCAALNMRDNLLQEQIDAMRHYRDCLVRRLERWEATV